MNENENILLLERSIDLIMKMSAQIKENPDIRIFSSNVIQDLTQTMDIIHEKNQQEKIMMKQQRNQEDYMKQVNQNNTIQKQETIGNFTPYYQILLKQFFNHSFLVEHVYSYFTLDDLIMIRGVNAFFLKSVNEYFTVRIKLEEQFMAKTIFSGRLINLNSLRYFIFNQIPQNLRLFINYDQRSCKETIVNEITKQDFEALKKIQQIQPDNDSIFAPFSLIFSEKLLKNQQGWFKKFQHLIQSLNLYKALRFIGSHEMVEANVFLAGTYLLELQKFQQRIQRYSKVCWKMLKWCEAIVSLYYLDNIFVIRNANFEEFDQSLHTIEDYRKIADTIVFFNYQHRIINSCKRQIKQDSKFQIYFDFSTLHNQAIQEQNKLLEI